MQLSFTDEQRMLADAARSFVERECPLDLVRELEGTEPGYAPEAWATMCGLGWLDLGMLELAVVCEELGRGLVPSPLIPTAVLAPGGGEIAALAADGPMVVPWAAAADVVFVLHGSELHAVREFTCERRDAFGGEPLYAVAFDPAVADPAGDARPALDRALVAAMAYAVGAAERTLEMTVEHAKAREQFGRPIGSFQAVAHRCVDMRSDVDACRFLAYRAAWALDEDVDVDLAVGAAKAYGNDALRRIFMHAHQVHGAIGFSTEHDLHLFTRRAKAFELTFGSSSFHRERVAVAMGL